MAARGGREDLEEAIRVREQAVALGKKQVNPAEGLRAARNWLGWAFERRARQEVEEAQLSALAGGFGSAACAFQFDPQGQSLCDWRNARAGRSKRLGSLAARAALEQAVVKALRRRTGAICCAKRWSGSGRISMPWPAAPADDVYQAYSAGRPAHAMTCKPSLRPDARRIGEC